MKILATIQGEGFTSEIKEDEQGRVWFLADADIDADGANGQNGGKAAYKKDDSGSELLANGGMGIRGGRVVGIKDWYRDIVVVDTDGTPLVLANGIIPSKTAYQFPGFDPRDPAAYVDAQMVPYIVVPEIVLRKTAGAVKGCICKVTNQRNGRSATGIVGDVGPRTKVGEVSIAMAGELGIPSSPRTGGEEKPVILYQLWPGEPGKICGAPVVLHRMDGTYVV